MIVYNQHEEKEEKSQEESWEEKWRRDPVSAALWAFILIWAGLVLLAGNMGLLNNLREAWGLASLSSWDVILVGAGLIVLLEVLIRVTMPEYRRSVGGTLIFGVILLGIGLGGIFGWNLTWPLILIAIGVGLLLRGLLGRRVP